MYSSFVQHNNLRDRLDIQRSDADILEFFKLVVERLAEEEKPVENETNSKLDSHSVAMQLMRKSNFYLEPDNHLQNQG